MTSINLNIVLISQENINCRYLMQDSWFLKAYSLQRFVDKPFRNLKH